MRLSGATWIIRILINFPDGLNIKLLKSIYILPNVDKKNQYEYSKLLSLFYINNKNVKLYDLSN